MNEQIEILKNKFSYISYENISSQYVDYEGNLVSDEYYKISNFNGNKNISLSLVDSSEIEDLMRVLDVNPIFLDEFLGIHYGGKYEIVLARVNKRPNGAKFNSAKLKISLNYFTNNLDILISTDDAPVLFFDKELDFGSPAKKFVLSITGFENQSQEGLNSDLRNIINSVLFDIEYNFNILLEPIELTSLNRRIPTLRKPSLALPKQSINFTYKKYIEELIQYFRLAEKVDYIPFKYLCYFHIIEYFSDRSAYYVVAEEVKRLLLKPDFQLKTNFYINQAVNIFKKENEKHLTDKIKLKRVLLQYVKKIDVEDYIKSINLFDHFSKELEFKSVRPFKLNALDFSNDDNFFQTLTNRIYSIRCSIVHSNPDFDESKAIPFAHTPDNVFRLNIELALVYEVSRNIILKSAE